MKKDKRFCLICQPKNRTIYFHMDEKTGLPWLWCNKCDRGYSLQQYCDMAGVDIEEFVSEGLEIVQDQADEVNAMSWPINFITLSDPRAEKGVQYIKSRGLDVNSGDMYYDLDREGIVFPYYMDSHFCGAQIRFIVPKTNENGSEWKITTLPGTRLGLLFYGWNQGKLLAQVKRIAITEGAFNAISLQQALNKAYGGLSNCPWRVFACSGSGVSQFQAETLKNLREQGYTVVCASDTDAAGIEMYQKLKDADAISHYAFTSDTEKDWNDLLKDMGHQQLAQYFLRSITKIDVG